MRIALSDYGTARLVERDDMAVLSVVIPDDWDVANLIAAVVQTGLGVADSDGLHVQVDVERVRQMVHIKDDNWHQGFFLLVRNAAMTGVVRRERGTIRVPVERVSRAAAGDGEL